MADIGSDGGANEHRQIMKKSWKMLGGTALAAAGLWAYMRHLDPEPHRSSNGHRLRLTDVPEPHSKEYAQAWEIAMGMPITSGNGIEMFKNGEEIYPAMLEAICEAKASITFESFEFYGDKMPRIFAEALADSARSGVKVKAILDYFGSMGTDPTHFDTMKEAGVDLVRWCRPTWYNRARLNSRTHRKLMVIDGRIGFTGGANVADPWIGRPENGAVRENHFRFEGPVVAQLQSAFMEHWMDEAGEWLFGDDFFPPLEAVGDYQAQTVSGMPLQGRLAIRRLYLMAIESARKSLKIAVAFFYPDPDMAEALCEAAERGVEVDVLVPGRNMELMAVRYASRNCWGPLLEAGVRIHEYDTAMYHAKSLIVDGEWASIGSANFDNRSFAINDEVNVNVFDRRFAKKLEDSFAEDLKECCSYDYERWCRRPWMEQWKGWVGNAFARQL